MKETLLAELDRLNIPVSEDTAQRLCDFARMMLRQNEVMNLTAITDESAVAKLHLADSLSLLCVQALDGKRIIDVGCGAGFPGVPIAIACPRSEVTLLDSLGKRMQWLASVLPQLGVQAHCITARAEEAVSQRRESFDIATSRAVARLNILLELTAPYVQVGGAVLALKGAAAQEELEQARRAIRILGLKLEQVRQLQIDGAERSILVFRKVAPTPPQYPRRYAKIKQAPL